MHRLDSIQAVFGPFLFQKPLRDCLLYVEEAAEHGIKAAHIQQAVAQRQDHCSCSLVLRGCL